jgi:hypothetical protein
MEVFCYTASMANLIKWVQKSKNNSLQPGEEILTSLGVSVQNKVKYMAAGVIGGAAGEVAAAEKLKTQENQELSQAVPSIEQYPHGAVIIALTQSRLLVYNLNFLGRPKSLGVSYARNELAKAEAQNSALNNTLTLTFRDGGTVTHDVSKAQGQELEKFVSLINEP